MKKPQLRQSKQSGTPIYRHDGAAVIGHVEGDIFKKRVRSTVHLLRKPRAWACDVDALDQAQAAGAVKVELLDQDTGATYRAALVEFYRHGVTVNRGHGPQLALPLAYWQVTGGRRLTRPGLDQTDAGPVQMRLL